MITMIVVLANITMQIHTYCIFNLCKINISKTISGFIGAVIIIKKLLVHIHSVHQGSVHKTRSHLWGRKGGGSIKV